jgi:hypothetical protein
MRMNRIELAKTVQGSPKWEKFAEKLSIAMGEYPLEGVTVDLRPMTAEEAAGESEDHMLAFSQESQRFDLALRTTGDFPAPWKIADRIDYFLNLDEEAAEAK